MTNTSKIGTQFENLVYDLLLQEINDGYTIVNPNVNFKIYKKKKYASRYREKNIEFDIAIEVFQNSSIEQYSLLFLVECKNYSGAVGVEEVNKFLDDVRDLTDGNFSHNIKPIIAINSKMSDGAFNKARNRGVGLIKISQENKIEWLLNRQFSSNRVKSSISSRALFVEDRLVNINHKSKLLLYLDDSWFSGLSDYFISTNSSTKLINNEVLFLSKETLENLAIKLLSEVSYEDGYVKSAKLLNHFKIKSFSLKKMPPDENHMLGSVDFSKKEIYLYTLEKTNEYRDRFTLFHELAHIFLEHGNYLQTEWFNDNQLDITITDSNIDRMEFQANFLASCLLMPKSSFVKAFFQKYNQLGLEPRGDIILYKDAQEVNVINVHNIVTNLSRTFKASKKAVELRLKELGLLQDETCLK